MDFLIFSFPPAKPVFMGQNGDICHSEEVQRPKNPCSGIRGTWILHSVQNDSLNVSCPTCSGIFENKTLFDKIPACAGMTTFPQKDSRFRKNDGRKGEHKNDDGFFTPFRTTGRAESFLPLSLSDKKTPLIFSRVFWASLDRLFFIGNGCLSGR